VDCTGYQSQAKALAGMDAAIEQGVIAEWGKHDSN